MAETYGWAGKILRVNLTTGEITTQDDAKYHKYIGGMGMAYRIMYEEAPMELDPYDEKALVIFGVGPLTGAGVPCSGRMNVTFRSTWSKGHSIIDAHMGGHIGSMLKYAGYDGIVVSGISEKPVYLRIEDGEVSLEDASEIWGKGTFAANKWMVEQNGREFETASIGPAGEKKVLLAAIMNDKDRAAGRSGVGAVMGSKKLKAIVVKATRKKLDNIADLDALKVAAKNAMDVLKANPVTGSGLRQLGTAVLVNIVNNIGAFPTKNWQESYYDKGDDISGETLAEKYLVKPGACHRCPIACGRVVNVNGKVVGGPEYEPLWAYGGNCGNNDLNVIDECNMLCNEYGLDAISVPCTIAAAMELYQRGYIKEEECAGVPLEWGSTRALVEWTKRMGNPETELDWLMSSGSARLCEHYGHPEYSMSVKKQEMPAYDARAIQGIGITYATSNRGGCHVRGYMISPEVLGLPQQLDRTVTNEKAAWVKTFQDLTAVIDSMGHCLFTSFAMGAKEYTDLLNAATGTNWTIEQVLEIGDRIYNIERMFNKAAGMKPEDDRLPKRLLEEPVVNGPSTGMTSKLPLTLPEYYEARGWVNAFPTDETLKKLGLDECVGK